MNGVAEGCSDVKAGWWSQIYLPFLFQRYFLCPKIRTLSETDVAVKEQ